MAAHGAMTISIDVEPAWAHRPIPRRIIDGLPLERAIVNRLVDLFARYDIRATWAIVGRWLLDTTGCQDAGLLPAVENAPKRPGSEEGDADRHDYDAAPLRGAEIVERLRRVTPPQEIASHSFCHIHYDERRTDRAAVRADIAEAKRVHELSRLPFQSFIFSDNVMGFRPLLAEAGILAPRPIPSLV